MLKSILKERWLTITALLLAVIVEISPIFLPPNNEKSNRVIYGILAVLVTVILEEWINRKRFNYHLKTFIKELKIIHNKHDVRSEAIQEIMRSVIDHIATSLNQKEQLDKPRSKDLYSDAGQHNCTICGKDHLTDPYARCQICKVRNSFWKKIN